MKVEYTLMSIMAILILLLLLAASPMNSRKKENILNIPVIPVSEVAAALESPHEMLENPKDLEALEIEAAEQEKDMKEL